MNNLYFKVYTDFTRYIPIHQSELEKALYAFQTGKPVIFENGAASRIESIIPDYNKAAGYYSDAKLSPDSIGDLEKYKPQFAGLVSKAKNRVQYFIAEGKTNLIGTGAEIPELDAPHEKLLEGVELLAKKMSV
jgi:hypothetical protein